MGKEAETKIESQAVLAVAQGDSVALAALRCRQSRAGSALTDYELGRKARSFEYWYQEISFRAGGKDAVESTEAIFACALAEGVGLGVGWWRASRAAPWRFWVKAPHSPAEFPLRIGREAASLFDSGLFASRNVVRSGSALKRTSWCPGRGLVVWPVRRIRIWGGSGLPWT